MILGQKAMIGGQNAKIDEQNAKIEATMTSKGLFHSHPWRRLVDSHGRGDEVQW